MLRRVYEYVKDEEFRFTVYNDRIHFINYEKIPSLNSDYILIESGDRKVSVKGKNMILNRLFEKEILIIGDVYTIEVIHG